MNYVIEQAYPPQIKTAIDRKGTKLIRIFTPEEDRDPRRDFWLFIDHF